MILDFITSHGLTVINLLIQCGLIKFVADMYKNYKAQVAEREQKNAALLEGMRSVLRSEIISMYYKSETQGYITIYNLENITDMYHAYTALGGNGAITEIYHKALALPHQALERR